MICAHCLEVLVATPAALRGFAHDHAGDDHPADPVEACAVCGGAGRIEVTNHGVACRVRGCGPEVGCVLVALVCQACERKELGEDLTWSADRMSPVSLLDRAWMWLAEAVVPGWALAIPAVRRAPLFFWPRVKSHGSSYQHTFDSGVA